MFLNRGEFFKVLEDSKIGGQRNSWKLLGTRKVVDCTSKEGIFIEYKGGVL